MTAAHPAPFLDTLVQARLACERLQGVLVGLAAHSGRPHPDERRLPDLLAERDLALRRLGVATLLQEAAADAEAVTEPGAPPDPPSLLAGAAGGVQLDTQALVRRFETGGHVQMAEPPSGPSPGEALVDAGCPARGMSVAEALRELDVLQTELTRLAHHPALSRALRTRVLSLMVARARVLQEEWSHPPVAPRLTALFSQLTRFVGEGHSDFVSGLKRSHRPASDSWRQEVGVRERSLRKALGRGLPVVESPPPTPPRTCPAPVEPPVAWRAPEALRVHTEGKACLVVGGDNRSATARRIESDFGFSSVTWEDGKKTRSLRATAKRLRNDRYDVVFFLRSFISHKVTDMLLPSARRSDGPCLAFVEQGYGRSAMERALCTALGLAEA
mgnify:CR=1 FL=1